jgi:hypothetical protein
MNPDASWGPDGSGRTNYAFCYGDTIDGNSGAWTPAQNRGMFQGRYPRRLVEATDGTSYTIAMGEIGTSPSGNLSTGQGKMRIQGGAVLNSGNAIFFPSNCRSKASGDRYNSSDEPNVAHLQGIRWADGAPAFSAFMTILPPNSASCVQSNDSSSALISSSSYHGSGVHVLFLDCGVRYIPNSIDSGSSVLLAPAAADTGAAASNPSQYGAWGAMGTRSAADLWDASAIE